MERMHVVNLDAGETVFFGRELEHIKAKTYDQVYASLKARQMMPISSEAGPGAETITYRIYDEVGLAKIISNYADDLPRADVRGKEETSPIKSIGNSYAYSVQDIRAAMKAGLPLPQRKANAARRAQEQLINTILLFGDAPTKLMGLLNNPNVPITAFPADGAGGLTTFASKIDIPNGSPKIVRDLGSLITGVPVLTKGIEAVRRVLLPLDVYQLLNTTPRSTLSDKMLLSFMKEAHPNVTFDWLNELTGAGVGGVNRILAYDPDPDKLEGQVPMEFEQFPVQEVMLEYKVPCHSRVAGVIWYYPLSGAYGDGA